MTRTILAALVGLAACTAPAMAQYYEYHPRPRYEEGGPRWHHRYEERRMYRERAFGRVCVTSRGSCRSAPGPIGTRCRCHIPGFGKKHGSIE